MIAQWVAGLVITVVLLAAMVPGALVYAGRWRTWAQPDVPGQSGSSAWSSPDWPIGLLWAAAGALTALLTLLIGGLEHAPVPLVVGGVVVMTIGFCMVRVGVPAFLMPAWLQRVRRVGRFSARARRRSGAARSRDHDGTAPGGQRRPR